MTHRLARADVEPHLHLLRDGRGWDVYVAAVNQARPGAPPASERTIRRVLRAHGLQADGYRLGGRPRKPDVSDAEFKLAIAEIEKHPGRPYVGLREAAAAISQDRVRRAGAVHRLDVDRHSISVTWLKPQLLSLGWVTPELVEVSA